MKRILFTILLAGIAFLNTQAQQIVINGINYNITSPTTVEVLANDPIYSGAITIPESVTSGSNIYLVTSIGDYGFYKCSGLTNITIPNSVTNIKAGAFSECTGLTSITIPNSVTSIGSVAFAGCSGLTNITIPNSVTSIGEGTFYGCSGLTNITIPNSVTSIGEGTFYGCSGLTSITIPNSVKSIGYGAFSNCSGLKNITIPNSVTSIGNWAFSGCSGLTNITIPNSVTNIKAGAFSECSGLTSVTVDWTTPLEIYKKTFSGAYAAKLYVPSGSKAVYQAATEWKKFKKIVKSPVRRIETINESNFSIFPNPATDKVTINLSESVTGTISIIDLDGNTVATKSISGNSTTISTADLASGVYVAKIVSDKGIVVKQVIVK